MEGNQCCWNSQNQGVFGTGVGITIGTATVEPTSDGSEIPPRSPALWVNDNCICAIYNWLRFHNKIKGNKTQYFLSKERSNIIINMQTFNCPRLTMWYLLYTCLWSENNHHFILLQVLLSMAVRCKLIVPWSHGQVSGHHSPYFTVCLSVFEMN